MDVLLLAIHPALIVAPVLLGTAAIGGGVWYFTRGKKRPLAPPRKPGELPPGPEPPGPTPIGELVDQYVGIYEDAAFHDTQSGDGIIRVVTRVLDGIDDGAGDDKNMRAALGTLINASQWNHDLISTPTTDDPYRDADGMGIHPSAWKPRHENMIGTMRAGFLPVRNIDAAGKKVGAGSSWATPWIPALNHDAVRNRAADPAILLAQPWPDGTPATEPPPALVDELRER